MHECNFSYSHYEDILKEIKINSDFSSFVDNSDRGIILRHDVDYSLDSALKMAQIENKLNVKSTYFILFHSELYNPFSSSSVNIINQIIKLGHSIGLHYDVSSILQMQSDPSFVLKQELETLENHFKTSIRVVSAHDPSINESLSIELLSTVVDAYSAEYTKKRKYLSDSVQFWREGCFCQHFKNNKNLQVLVHPVWWTEDNQNRNEIMKSLIGTELDTRKKQIDKDCTIYKNYIKKMNQTY